MFLAVFSSETCRVLLKINKYVEAVNLVGLTIGMYYDARIYKSQIEVILFEERGSGFGSYTV